MKIETARFIQSATGLKDAPFLKHHPEWVLVGRSNVGKSSFINRMLGRKNLAKTSNTPGKTRLINYYSVNESFLFVDLPGYGYAKVSQAEQTGWRKNLEAYLKGRSSIQLIIQLIDARHGPQSSDVQMLTWLAYHHLPFLVVLTKADKIARSQLERRIDETTEILEMDKEQVVPFSAITGLGREAIWKVLTAVPERVL